MPIIKYNNKAIFFVHIPKTGGTSIYANLINQGAIIEDYNPYVPVFENVSSHHLDKNQIQKYFNEVTNKFSIIRDPWSRTISDYVYSTNDTKFKKINNWIYVNLIKYKKTPTIADNHIKPMVKFIDAETKLFHFKHRKLIHNWINVKLGNNFLFNIQKNVSKKYKNISKKNLSIEVLTLWTEIYYEDICLYYRLYQ